MKLHLAALLVAVILAAPALAITLTTEEQAGCAAEGGCIVITAQRLEREIAALRAKTLRECKGST